MPEIVWQPMGPTNHRIPDEYNDLPTRSIVVCECGGYAIFVKDDYGHPKWRHLYAREIWWYRWFHPERLGLPSRNTGIISRGQS